MSSEIKGFCEEAILKLRLPIVFLTLALLASGPAFAEAVLGQVASGEVEIDGVAVLSGTSLLSESVVRTSAGPAVFHLENGGLLQMQSHTTARMGEAAPGELEVAVELGAILGREASGALFKIAQNDSVVLDREGRVSSGADVNGTKVLLCKLEEPRDMARCHRDPGADDCVWSLVEVDESEVEGYLELGAVHALENDLGLDATCNAEDNEGLFPLSTGQIVGVSLAGAAAVYLVIDDDDETETSPITP